MKSFTVEPAARSDLRRAKQYYEERQPGLGKHFLEETWQRIQLLLLHPMVCPVVDGSIRKAKVHDFPFHVYYFVRGEEIVVIAVLHQRRRPGSWKRRS